MILVSCILLLTSCVTPIPSDAPDEVPEEVEQSENPPEEPIEEPSEAIPSRQPYSFRGDPHFDLDDLTPTQRTHYTKLLDEISDTNNRNAVFNQAASDNLFVYGRVLHPYVESVLIAFRMTGDLTLLDYVDTIAQRMREELHDDWRDTLDGTDGTQDGYLNWVYRYHDSSTQQFVGKDTIQLDEIRTHALIAQIAYALDQNRDLESPSGHDYGAHADFWEAYLVDHFEAKWRERKDTPTEFPFMGRPGSITYYAWTKWHYYMWKLTGSEDYGVEANRMSDNVWAHMRAVETPSGTAYVWSRRVIDPLINLRESSVLTPSSYALSIISHAIDLHYEGFHRWADEEEMRSLARTFTEFIIDTDDPVQNGFAPDIGGGVSRAGLEPPEWGRLNHATFLRGGYSFLSVWDETGRIIEVVDAIQQRNANKDTSALAASLFVHSWLHPAEDTNSTGVGD